MTSQLKVRSVAGHVLCLQCNLMWANHAAVCIAQLVLSEALGACCARRDVQQC
jgi:hypothetical protein